MGLVLRSKRLRYLRVGVITDDRGGRGRVVDERGSMNASAVSSTLLSRDKSAVRCRPGHLPG